MTKSTKKYEIRFLNFKTPKKIPENAKELINRAIVERLASEPNKYGKPLAGNLKNLRRIRVSYYRIIYHVDDEKNIVTIKAIDYRRDIYE